MRLASLAVAAAAFAVSLQMASATVVVLNFKGLENAGFDDGPLNYYAGGLSLAGSGPGPNYGITFSANAYTCGTGSGDVCNGLAKPPAPGNFLIFSNPGGPSVMNVAGGFSDGFALYYSNIFGPHYVQIYSGLDGTGTLLATLNLPSTPLGFDLPECGGASTCPFLPAGVTFSGLAHSVTFGDATNEVAFADLTLGSPVSAVPEPTLTSLLVVGLASAFAARRRRSSSSAEKA